MLQTALPVHLAAGQVLLEYRVLLRLPLPVCLGADDRLPDLARPLGDPALRLAGHAGVRGDQAGGRINHFRGLVSPLVV